MECLSLALLSSQETPLSTMKDLDSSAQRSYVDRILEDSEEGIGCLQVSILQVYLDGQLKDSKLTKVILMLTVREDNISPCLAYNHLWH